MSSLTMSKEKAIIVDLDGTLAHMEHRVSLVRQNPPDWKNFIKKIPQDEVNQWCLEIIDAMISRGYKIIIITGRGESSDELTRTWLKDHKILFHEFYSRKSKDRRGDAEVKKEIYLNYIKDRYDVLFVLDDRLSVVKMWRDDLKLTTLQPEWGDF